MKLVLFHSLAVFSAGCFHAFSGQLRVGVARRNTLAAPFRLKLLPVCAHVSFSWLVAVRRLSRPSLKAQLAGELAMILLCKVGVEIRISISSGMFSECTTCARSAEKMRSSGLYSTFLALTAVFSSSCFVADAGKAQSASKNGKRSDSGSSSFFTWFIVLALLGVWTSVAVVYFDLVDYQGVLGERTLTSALRSLYCDQTLPVSEL